MDEEEERMLLQAFQNILASYPHAVMILAPRHPERFPVVAALLESLGVRFWRRSLWNGEPISGGVILLDSIGELAAIYGLADIAFVGGSLVPKGGHNIIEPARHGVAIVVGNHTENFRDIIWLFQTQDAVRIVGPAELPLVLMELISNGPGSVCARPARRRNVCARRPERQRKLLRLSRNCSLPVLALSAGMSATNLEPSSPPSMVLRSGLAIVSMTGPPARAAAARAGR